MRWICILLGLTLAAGAGVLPKQESGDVVALVYNLRMPGSKEVAEHYAAVRHVPENQILGLNLTTNEAIGRKEYQTELENPLRSFLETQKLLVMEADTQSTNAGALRVKESKIRYVVLCYGVPVSIGEDGGLVEPGEDKIPKFLRRNGAAVDTELCLLPWPNPNRMLAGVTANPFYATTNGGLIQPANGVLMVTRLDGPDAFIARGLVDKAMEAESYGLWGRAYFDLRILPDDQTSKEGDSWIKGAANAARVYGFDVVLDDQPATFSAGFPMSQIALYAGWYDGQVSGPFTQSNVEFMPGAFAYHLHSFSAQVLRTTTLHWCGPLLAKGAAATMGCVDEPYLAGTPIISIFFARWLAGMSFGEAAYASQQILSWQTTVIGDPLYRPFARDPQLLHQSLIARGSPLVEWSHERVVNLSFNHGVAPSRLIDYLQTQDATARSAVLTEKMGDLYLMQGLTNLAINAWQQALALKPTPLQAVRLTFDIGEKLAESGRGGRALDTYDAFLKQCPKYPDALPLLKRLEALAKSIHEPVAAQRYAEEIARLSAGSSSAK